MGLNQLLDQVQAKPSAPILACGAHINLLKGIEDFVILFLMDADARVAYGNLHHLLNLVCSDRDSTTMCELARIANQIVEDLDDAPCVSQDWGDACRNVVDEQNSSLGLKNNYKS